MVSGRQGSVRVGSDPGRWDPTQAGGIRPRCSPAEIQLMRACCFVSIETSDDRPPRGDRALARSAAPQPSRFLSAMRLTASVALPKPVNVTDCSRFTSGRASAEAGAGADELAATEVAAELGAAACGIIAAFIDVWR